MIRLSCAASGSSGNCYSLTDESGNVLLLDAGILLQEIKKLVNWKTSSIVGAFISHDHNDHSKSADKLRKMGIPVFEPYKSDTDRAIGNMIQGFKMVSFRLPHDDVANCGVVICTNNGHKLLYMTDFSYCKFTFKKLNINTIIIECNHMDDVSEEDNEGKLAHVLRGHSSISVVKEFLRINKTDALKTVVLCHLSAENADPEEMKKQVRKVVGNKVQVVVAERGMNIEL